MVPSAPISAAVVTLGELFSDANRFRLPHFQRAYAWSTAQVSRLLADLIEALRGPEGARRHFLGRLLLARPPGGDGISVIDGHQRLMTLTILFAVLRDLSADESERIRAASCIGTVIRAGSTEQSLRLVPHAGLAAFMSDYVQAEGATLVEFESDESGLSETETNIIVNRDYLRGQLTQAEDADRLRRDLSLFLVERCRVVVIEVEDEIEAWSMLQTEEQTRLGFNATDRAKASILSAMPAADREICGPVWEHWQSRLGAKRMRGLLAHVRTLELRRRSDVPVETELIRHFELHRGAVAFFEQHLVPRAERLVALRSSEPWPAPDRAAIARVLETIRWVDRQLWVPSALLWLELYGPAHAGTREFLIRLERLAWMLRLAGIDPQIQRTRFLRLLSEIDRTSRVTEMPSLDIERKVLADALQNLRSRTFYYKQYCSAALKRVSVAMGADAADLAAQHSTIEHVLPRNLPSRRLWWRTFGNKERILAYANRLGNLTLLSHAQNQEAGSNDWPEKREGLGGSSFLLSQLAAREMEWTPATIERRTDALIAALMADWSLSVAP